MPMYVVHYYSNVRIYHDVVVDAKNKMEALIESKKHLRDNGDCSIPSVSDDIEVDPSNFDWSTSTKDIERVD